MISHECSCPCSPQTVPRLSARPYILCSEVVASSRVSVCKSYLDETRTSPIMSDQRVVVLGHGGVGKSSLTLRLITDNFMEEYDPTIEDSYQKSVVVDGESTVLNVLDTAGQEEYSSMQDQWMREGRAFLLVYSVTNQQTFEHLDKIREKLIRVKQAKSETTVPIILVGNKVDLEGQRQVLTDMGKDKASKWRCPFFETSAKNKVNCPECFHEAVRLIRRANNRDGNKREKSKSKRRMFCALL